MSEKEAAKIGVPLFKPTDMTHLQIFDFIPSKIG